MADVPLDPPQQHIGDSARRMAHEALGATERLVGADPAVPLRVIVMFIVAAVCMAPAPLPYAAVGEVLLVLLALDVAHHRRA